MAFRYQAVDAAGQTLVDTIDADSVHQAADALRERGLFVTRLDTVDDSADDTGSTSRPWSKTGGRLRDVVMFTQQMAMLTRSGARVVPALEAVESQAQRAGWRKAIRTVRVEVEAGRPLSEALSKFPKLFSGVYVNMVAAGEASGDLPLAFERLGVLTRQQQEIRSRVIGALTYPALLLLLCIAVIVGLFIFVLPRFAAMFEMLDVELPTTTAALIAASDGFRAHWPHTLGAIAATVVGAVMLVRGATGRRWTSRLSVRIPVLGALVRNIILARVCRVWGQLIESKVGLLDTIRLTQQSTGNLDFAELLTDIEQVVIDGNTIGPALKRSWLLPKTFAAAIITGEESGRLADSLLFVASCLEDENTQVLNSLARLIEPVILTAMGVIVGTVAISLFVPMFDLATIAGR